jgi:two-component system alkaline phosphatase synthesis response regulator PhoP
MKKVLLVDDNSDLRYSVIEGLKFISPDISFIEADGGEKALTLLKTQKVDAILLDIMMPGMDGWEVAARLKADSNLKKIPVLFLTAKTDEFSKGMGSITGEDYIEKPFEAIDLKKRLDKVLKK